MKTKTLLASGSLALLLSACAGSGDGTDPIDDAGDPAPREAGPDESPDGPAAPPAASPDGDDAPAIEPGSFFDVDDSLEESARRRAALTRDACAADHARLRTLLDTGTSTTVFHATGGPVVDIEWIELDVAVTDVDGPIATRRGTGATFEGVADADGAVRCLVTPYESFGGADADGGPFTSARVDAGPSQVCRPDGANPAVRSENVPLLVVVEDGTSHAYGSIGTRYTLDPGGPDAFETEALRRVVRRTDPDDGRIDYVAECGEPEALPDGRSVLDAPVPTVPPVLADGPTDFAGRSWQATARTARHALDARGLDVLRTLAERAAAELGLVNTPAVDTACPAGGSANATSSITARRDERHYVFAACELGDGTRIDGVYDVVRRDDDEGESVNREIEERFELTAETDGITLRAGGTSSDALTGRRADACGVHRQERVLRLDIPSMRVGDVAVTSLAVEDITNTRPSASPAADGCPVQLTEYAFSDSARVRETLAPGTDVAFSVNRTGSIVLDANGAASSSGRDASVRIYDAEADDSLDIVPDFTRADGVTVTIDRHPGRSRFADTWRFVEP